MDTSLLGELSLWIDISIAGDRLIRKVVLFLGVALLIFSTHISLELFMPLRFKDNSKEINIPRGSSFKQAIAILSQNSGQRDLTVLYVIGRLKGVDRRLKPGWNKLSDYITPLEILDKFNRGDTVKIKLSIIPGYSLREIRLAMINSGLSTMQDFEAVCTDMELMAELHIDAPSVEGYLLPETYIIEKGMSVKEAVVMMVRLLRMRYPRDFTSKAQTLGMSEHEVLTLASIIEKEAQRDVERSIISAVYHNRLRRRMPLQADPTAIYGLKSAKEGVKAADLRNDNPYNTYKIAGLPPGPIASPSLSSISAAINPSNLPYLYFVAKNDGTHHFSTTYREHREAVNRYQKHFSKEYINDSQP